MATFDEKLAALDDYLPADIAEEIRKHFEAAKKEHARGAVATKGGRPVREDKVTLKNLTRVMDGDVVAAFKVLQAIRAQESEQRRLDERFGKVSLKKKKDKKVSDQIDQAIREVQAMIDEVKGVPKTDLGWNGKEASLDLAYWLGSLPADARREVELFISKSGLVTGAKTMYKDTDSDAIRNASNLVGAGDEHARFIRELMAQMRQEDPKLFARVSKFIADYGLDEKHHIVVSDADLVKGGQQGPTTPRRESVQKEARGDFLDQFMEGVGMNVSGKVTKKEKRKQLDPLGQMIRDVGRGKQ